AVYAQGHLLFVRGGTLMAQPFDAKRLEMAGEAAPLAEGVERTLNTRTSGIFSVSNAGLLVFHGGDRDAGRVFTWFDHAGMRGAAAGEPASIGPAFELSPDEKSVAAELGNYISSSIWIYDLARGVRSRLTLDSGSSSAFPVWSPDGRFVAFQLQRGDQF